MCCKCVSASEILVFEVMGCQVSVSHQIRPFKCGGTNGFLVCHLDDGAGEILTESQDISLSISLNQAFVCGGISSFSTSRRW
jgi:hypothetical protein